jgi:hypothetical protein
MFKRIWERTLEELPAPVKTPLGLGVVAIVPGVAVTLVSVVGVVMAVKAYRARSAKKTTSNFPIDAGFVDRFRSADGAQH